MTTLTEFLLARIAEDEAAARSATQGQWVRYGDGRFYDYTVGLTPAFVPWPQTGGNRSPGRDYSAEIVGGVQEADGTHIVRWNPARVLAECEAKRRIVEFHSKWPVLVEGPPRFDQPGTDLNTLAMRMTREIAWLTQQEYVKRFGTEAPTAPMLRVLAMPYADHPDYDENWRP